MTTEQCGQDQLPIGLFDSGVGGLTVLDAMRRLMPGEDYLFLGDTARVPYGAKSQKTIVRYSLQAAAKLIGQRIKLLVIACNTATAAALPALRETWPDMPIIGVIEPGSRAACEASPSGDIAVIATESTIRSGAYAEAILRRRPEAQVRSLACPLFVPLVENGYFGADNAVTRLVARDYLKDIRAAGVDTLILGCTHYPLIAPIIADLMGPEVALIDPGRETALAARDALASAGLLREGRAGTARYYVSDTTESFAQLSDWFLGEYAGGPVTRISVDGYPVEQGAST